jgi:CheY-like chemotaxis protein
MNKPRILVVDDDPNVSRLVAAHLEKSGAYQVLIENRPYAAMSVARAFRPDLVFLDVDMPGKDGGQIAAEIRADTDLAKTPIVFLTSLVAHSEVGDEPKILGGFPFLAKPTTPGTLDRTVRTMLAKPGLAAA